MEADTVALHLRSSTTLFANLPPEPGIPVTEASRGAGPSHRFTPWWRPKFRRRKGVEQPVRARTGQNCAANHVPLSPLSFLESYRADLARPRSRHAPAVSPGREFDPLPPRLRIAARGIAATRYGVMPNVPAMVEAHYDVPMIGAVLNTLNTRLDPRSPSCSPTAGQVRRSPTRVRLVMGSRARALRRATSRWSSTRRSRGPWAPPRRDRLRGVPRRRAIPFAWRLPADEWDAISLNYTSGTTGNPKGGSSTTAAPPQRASNIIGWGMPRTRLPVDAADVPLQRLVLRVDDGGQRRRQRVPAQRSRPG